MAKDLLKLLLILIALVFIQVFILNGMKINGYINPYVYVLFILILPFETPGWVLLVCAFILGLVIDSFMNTLGMHSSATLFMAFSRQFLLKIISFRNDNDSKGFLTLGNFGFVWTLRYVAILVFAHHFFLFFLESFSFSSFFPTMGRIILSSAFTIFFILLAQYMFARK